MSWPSSNDRRPTGAGPATARLLSGSFPFQVTRRALFHQSGKVRSPSPLELLDPRPLRSCAAHCARPIVRMRFNCDDGIDAERTRGTARHGCLDAHRRARVGRRRSAPRLTSPAPHNYNYGSPLLTDDKQIGACRHGDRCSRLHNKPQLSQTILMTNMYQSPEVALAAQAGGVPPQSIDPRQLQEHFEDFYEDIFEELATYGEIEGVNVCDNLADHLVGNVYVKYREEESAQKALNALNGRFYSGRPILCEFSPVTDFRESTCRQYEENTCTRGGYCNFMHLKPISRNLRKALFGRYKSRDRDRDRSPRGRDYHEGRRDDRYGDDRYRNGRGGDDRYDHGRRGGSRDRDRDRSRSRSRERGRGGSRDRGRDDRYGDDRGQVSAKGMSDEERRAMFAKWNENDSTALAGDGVAPPAANGDGRVNAGAEPANGQ